MRQRRGTSLVLDHTQRLELHPGRTKVMGEHLAPDVGRDPTDESRRATERSDAGDGVGGRSA